MNKGINVGVVGATGMVGEVFLSLLATRGFPVNRLKLFASDRSKGQTRDFRGQSIPVEPVTSDGFAGLDLVFFSSGDDVSREWGPVAVRAGAFAVDNSAAFRMDPATPLIVPEVNGNLLPKVGRPALIANPNCSTIQLVLALNPLRRSFGLESVHVATYQAVSGAGRGGQDELLLQTKAWIEGRQSGAPQTFPHPIAFNCIPQIGSFADTGFCSEEIKITRETKKILGDDSFRVSAFTARIPAWNSHSEAVWVRLSREVERSEILASLLGQAGIKIYEDGYPTALDLNGHDKVGIGRIHRDLDDPRTWLMWIVGDNLRKGAALNGIQIAERIFDIHPAA